MIQELIPVVKFIKDFLKSKKLIFLCFIISLVLAILTILNEQKEYIAHTSFITQTGGDSSVGSGLRNIADLIGVNIGSKKEFADIPVYLYPKLIGSLSYNRNVLNSEVMWYQNDTLIPVKKYFTDNYKPSAASKLRKYTIGLPGVIKRSFFKSKESTGYLKVIDSIEYISKEEAKIISLLQSNLELNIDKEDGTIHLTMKSKNPEISAQIAQIAREKLQEKIIEYRILKAKEGFDFIDKEYKIKKEEYLKAQDILARYIDRNRFNNTERSLIKRKELENNVALSYAVYSGLENQRIGAQISIKKDTPVFATINPSIIPLEASNNSAILTIFKFVFTSFLIALFIFSYRKYIHLFKEYWNEA